jgi:hypothetical protein
MVISTKESSTKGSGDVWLKAMGVIPERFPKSRPINPNAKSRFDERKKTQPRIMIERAYR